MGIAVTLKEYLSKNDIRYYECTHEHSATALESARATHIPSDVVVKAVLLSDGTDYLLAALPANRRLAMARLCDFMDRDYDLANEDEIADVFRDCEVGAIPPAGAAYGINVIWDDALNEPTGVYLEAGDHETLLRVEHDDFLRLMGGATHSDISQTVVSY